MIPPEIVNAFSIFCIRCPPLQECMMPIVYTFFTCRGDGSMLAYKIYLIIFSQLCDLPWCGCAVIHVVSTLLVDI